MAVMSLIVPILGYYPLKTRGAAGAFIRVLSKFFDQVGNETKYASTRNQHFFTVGQ